MELDPGLGGSCLLTGNFGVERGHYEASVAVVEQQLLPAVPGVRRCDHSAGRRRLLPEPSWKTQASAVAHLAELIAALLNDGYVRGEACARSGRRRSQWFGP